MESGAMTVHAIDAMSGELKPGPRVTMGTQPNWVEIVDLTKG